MIHEILTCTSTGYLFLYLFDALDGFATEHTLRYTSLARGPRIHVRAVVANLAPYFSRQRVKIDMRVVAILRVGQTPRRRNHSRHLPYTTQTKQSGRGHIIVAGLRMLQTMREHAASQFGPQ